MAEGRSRPPAATTEELALAKETLEERMTALYRLHPREFVAARDGSAAEVKRDDAGRAEEVHQLRKATLAAWSLNVVSHDRPEEVGEELSVGRLTRPRPRPSGIADLATMLDASSTRRPRRDRERTEQLRRRLEKAEATLERHRDELARAQGRLAKAREAVRSAERRVDEDREELEELEHELGGAAG